MLDQRLILLDLLMDPFIEKKRNLLRLVIKQQLQRLDHVLEDLHDHVLNRKIRVEQRVKRAHFDHEIFKKAVNQDPHDLLNGLVLADFDLQKVPINGQQEALQLPGNQFFEEFADQFEARKAEQNVESFIMEVLALESFDQKGVGDYGF